MFNANNKNGDKVFIKDANREEEYFCPICKEKLILKCGKIKAMHFAHKIKSDCEDWGDMSEWHLKWQERFPKECREVVIGDGKEKHRADILIESTKTVIEFQHSNISEEVFRRRNLFYTNCGYKLIWAFHIEDGKKIKEHYKNTIDDFIDKLDVKHINFQDIERNNIDNYIYKYKDIEKSITHNVEWKVKQKVFLNIEYIKNLPIIVYFEVNNNHPVLLKSKQVDEHRASIVWLKKRN